MIDTHETEVDLNYAVQISRAILRPIGAWPMSSDPGIPTRTLTRVLNLICYFLFLATLIPGLLRIFLKEKNPRVQVKMFGPLFNCFICMVKYTVLLYRAGEIRDCMVEMREDWRRPASSDDRELMRSRARTGRRLGLLSAVFMYGGGLSYRTIVPLSRGTVVTANNVTIRALPCPGYYVKFDEQISPAYEIVFVIQFFAGFISFSVTCGVCGLAAFFVMHICGQLKILIRKMVDLSEGSDFREDIVGRQLADIVQYQIKVKGFLKQVDVIIQHMCLVEIVGCTCLICLVGYYVILEWESSDATAMFTYFVLLVSFIFSIFVFCYIGQLLTNEGNEVAEVSSTINWYRLPTRKARYMVLIMAMSNHPIKITGGKMVEMSLSSFSNIIKASVGYFNILRKTID